MYLDSWLSASLQLSAVQDLDEGFAKLDVEGGVDDGVDGAVEVSKPGDGAVQRGRDTAAPAVRLQHVGQEERQPADDEHAWETETGSGVKEEHILMKNIFNEKSYWIFISQKTMKLLKQFINTCLPSACLRVYI